MYRPGIDPQFRPKTVVPPPPPQGMMNYAPQRPLPPPNYGRSYSSSQFSYATGPPPPPLTSLVPNMAAQSAPSLLHTAPFLPPLPSDLPPPPPPLSPPPSPPPLPPEAFVTTDSIPPPPAEDLEKKKSTSGSLSGVKEVLDAKFRPGFYDDPQQKSLIQHVSAEAASRGRSPADLKDNVPQSGQYSDWNATYQDTLDDETVSPTTSDMDMDMEDVAQLREHHSKAMPEEIVYPANDSENSVVRNDGHGHSSASALPRSADEMPSLHCCPESASVEPEGSQIERSSRMSNFSSSQASKPMIESHNSGNFPLVIEGKDKAGSVTTALQNVGYFVGSHASQSASGTGGVGLSITEELGNADIVSGITVGLSTHSTSPQQEHKSGLIVDEFGRLAQQADSDDETDKNKHEPPTDEFGRIIQKELSGSDSEGTRHLSKRKRSYSSSRSRSRSRSRNVARGRGRVHSRSRSGRSRSRSWSWSSRSRSRSRSASSRSPARSPRRRRQSFSRSPPRKMRWSRSRSRSPEWRRSYSRTPPRDMRWGIGRGDREWRGDRDHFGRGRRGGRGAGSTPCFHFARGRCFRGTSCWYSHVSREAMAQDRGAWRRDTQLERPNLDGGREEHSADQHSRGPWRRDGRIDRSDDFGGVPQENINERQKKELVSNQNVAQEEFGREPTFNRAVMPFQPADLWTTRSADETKDRQVNAYNKALELVGIPHIPGESVMMDEPGMHDEVQELERVDGTTLSGKDNIADDDMTVTEAPRKLTSMKLEDGGVEITGFEPATLQKESPQLTVDHIADAHTSDSTNDLRSMQQSEIIYQDSNITGNSTLENQWPDEVINKRDELEQHGNEICVSKRQGLQNGSEGVEECDNRSERVSHKVMSVDSDTDPVKVPGNVTEIHAGRDQEARVPDEMELGTEIDPHDRIHGDRDGLAEASKLQPVVEVDGLESDLIQLEEKLDAAKADVGTQPGVPSDSATTVGFKKVSKSDEEEVSETVTAPSVSVAEQTDSLIILESNDTGGVSDSVEGELPVTVLKADNAEIRMNNANSAPLLGHHPHGLHNTSVSHQGAGILRAPSDVQQYVSAGQHISGPGSVTSIPPQVQFQAPAPQPFPTQTYSSTSVQYSAGARDTSRSSQYSAYRLPAVRSLTSPQTFDRQVAQFGSGNPGYPAVGGWGQGTFQSHAPDPLPLNQVYGLPSYGTPSRPNTGMATSGVPFYGTSNQGDKYSHHVPPYPSDQASHQTLNPGDQFSQLPRPSSGGGFGLGSSGGYSSAYSGGFGPPSLGGSFSQHHIASNSGAPFSQPQVTPTIAGSFVSHQPAQSHGPIFLSQPFSQNFGPTNQAGYGSNFPGQPSTQAVSVSSSQPVQASQAINSSGNLPFAQLQIATSQHGQIATSQHGQQGQQGLATSTNYLPEQSQPLGPFGVVPTNIVMQPGVINTAFSSNTAVPTSVSGQATGSWSLQALQRPVIQPPGQTSAYSYPLTTIPPLSGLVQVSQSSGLAVQNDQYDPLSDVTGLGVGGAPKVVPATAHSDGGTSGVEKAKVEKASNPTSILEATELEAKPTTEDVGVVENLSPENWSPGPPGDDAEPDKGQALSKKSSRGLKMLRAAIADHVKEVLKPTWKEGYMSKEAFKTIAKKAVEKVVANLPSHHIPKSQEKVDQFMKSSRPKISKLVQGYVDKYLKL